MNQLNVRIERVPRQLTAVVKAFAPQSQLSRVIPATCGEVWAFAKAQKLASPGRMITLYHDDQFNMEIGVEIAAPFADQGKFICSELPACLAAVVTHVGPYAELAAVHAAIHKWSHETGNHVTDPAWEVYDHPAGPDAVPRTDVYYRLKKQS